MMTYRFAERYRIAAVCVTPLHIGTGDTELVLRNWQGNALIQGTSLAGALRSWGEKTDADLTLRLFGNQNQVGSLLISDGIFANHSDSFLRPRLRIDAKTGSAVTGHKFDLAYIPGGTAFEFEILWTGMEHSEEEIAFVEQLLSALHCGEITLGAQKTNGFGRVELYVAKQSFDMKNEEDRKHWMEEDQSSARMIELPALQRSRLVKFVVTGYADHFLVKSAAARIDANNQRVTTNLREKDVPILPGSSIKGAVRARAAMIAQFLNTDAKVLEELFGSTPEMNKELTAGKVYFQDTVLQDRHTDLARIRVDRFTGGVIRKGLFVEESLCSPVKITISAPEHSVGCKLLILALRDLGLGLYGFGSGSNVGRGYLSDVAIYAEAPDGRKAKLLFDAERQCTQEDPDGLFAEWMKAESEGAV